MTEPSKIDGALVQWGERLFYPHNRIVKVAPQPRLARSLAQRAALVRSWIEATVVHRAPQVMVKVTGGGRGMKAIAAHFRYISKNGRLDIEDEQGQVSHGREAVRELAEDWRYGGTLIDDISHRREAFNIILSMPRGTDPMSVLRSAREFAQAELAESATQTPKRGTVRAPAGRYVVTAGVLADRLNDRLSGCAFQLPSQPAWRDLARLD